MYISRQENNNCLNLHQTLCKGDMESNESRKFDNNSTVVVYINTDAFEVPKTIIKLMSNEMCSQISRDH